MHGPSVARGYWGRAEATAEAFAARLVPDDGDGPFLRTGDLGFVLDGELYAAGRIKDTIILDGLKHYPQDIERTVEQSHPGVRAGCGAAFSIDDGARERVVIVYEPSPELLDVDPVFRAITRAVSAAHGVAVAAIRLVERGTIRPPAARSSAAPVARRTSRARWRRSPPGRTRATRPSRHGPERTPVILPVRGRMRMAGAIDAVKSPRVREPLRRFTPRLPAIDASRAEYPPCSSMAMSAHQRGGRRVGVQVRSPASPR